MKTGIIIGVIFLFVVFFIFRSKRRLNRYMYELASNFEKNKDYEAACYYYAVAIFIGHDRKSLENKIRELWRSHGPFDFKKQLDEAKADGEDITPLIVADIQKIVKADQ